jgi:ABC-2 type transport system permease protein
MIAKELRLIVKDRMALFLIFLLPAVLIGVLWYVIGVSDLGSLSLGGQSSGEQNGVAGANITLGVIDKDTSRTYSGEDLSENFTAYLGQLVSKLIFYSNTHDAYLNLYNQTLAGYVVIPDGFEANLTINEPTYIELHVDATKMIEQSTVMATVQGATIMFRASKMWIRSEVFPSMTIEFTPKGGYIATAFGGFIVIFSSYLGIAMTAAQSIVGDVPLRRMLLTPTNRLEVVVAKVAAYVVVGFFQSLLLVSLWVIAFDLTLNTGFEVLVIVMTLVSLSGSATGILISAVSSSRLQANQMFLFVMFATLILAGFFVDVGALDEYMPMNQGMKLLINTAFKGLTLLQVLWPVMKLLAFSVGAILVATFVFSKKPTLG